MRWVDGKVGVVRYLLDPLKLDLRVLGQFGCFTSRKNINTGCYSGRGWVGGWVLSLRGTYTYGIGVYFFMSRFYEVQEACRHVVPGASASGCIYLAA